MKVLRWLGRTLWNWFTVEPCTCIPLRSRGPEAYTILRDPWCSSPDCIFGTREATDVR